MGEAYGGVRVAVVAEPAQGYPAHWEADVVLADGGVAHVRPIQPQDGPALHAFHDAQSPESVYLRFFAPLPHLSQAEVARFTHVDHVTRVALVATLNEAIVGVARYDQIRPGTAEVAFNVSDAHQGRGLGTVLLEHLAAAARERGITRFVAEVLPQNRRMITVFTAAGYEVRSGYDDGVIELEFDIAPSEHSAQVRESREHRAEARSMHALLHPASVVVLGSADPASLGARVLQNLVAGRLRGVVHAVDPLPRDLCSHAHTDLGQISAPVDLAVVDVPAEAAEQVIRDCAALGVRAVVVLSAGFAEVGPDGQARQAALVRAARSVGMRVVGPNSFGIFNNAPDVRLNASVATTLPPPGRFGLFSQSGALGVAVLDSAARRSLGVSSFVSAGNRADVSGNDVMQYWLDDASTDAVGLYLESMGNPRKFSRIARRLASSKPVIVVKSGLSSFGVPPGHTVRTSLLPREALDQMLRQSGVIRAENVHQLFDVAQLVVHQPLPAGSAVGIVTNSHALGALAADACVSWGLTVAHGPVALLADARTEEFRAALQAAFDDDGVDSVVVGFIPPLKTSDADVARALADVAGAAAKTCVATFLGMRGLTEALSFGERTVPAYPTPEDSVRALASATKYAQWRRTPRGPAVARSALARTAARDLVLRRTPAGPEGVWLGQEDCTALLGAYGIALRPPVQAPTVEESLGAGPGLACVVRTSEDPLFGPVVEFGIAGPPTELLGDVSRGFPPLHLADVAEMVRSLRAAPLLFGHHGADPVDIEALEDLIARSSLLADDLAQVAHLELSPVVVGARHLAVLGARIRLAQPPGRADNDLRRMPG